MATRLLPHLHDIRTTVKAVASVASKIIVKQKPLGVTLARPTIPPVQVCWNLRIQVECRTARHSILKL